MSRRFVVAHIVGYEFGLLGGRSTPRGLTLGIFGASPRLAPRDRLLAE